MSDAYRRRLLEFADLVARLRLHQRRYFRKKDNLAACRDYERRVDEQTKEILGTMQLTLFEGFMDDSLSAELERFRIRESKLVDEDVKRLKNISDV